MNRLILNHKYDIMITAGELMDLMRMWLNNYPTYYLPLEIDGKEVDKVYMDNTKDMPTLVITTKKKKDDDSTGIN